VFPGGGRQAISGFSLPAARIQFYVAQYRLDSRSKQIHKSNCGRAQARPAGTDDWSQTASHMAL
jgi:hypothetical protein